MPDKSAAQQRLMQAVAHGWHKPGGGGPSKAVAKEFIAADKREGVKFSRGGFVVHTEAKTHFVARGKDGTDFQIAKSGLPPHRIESYRKMCAGGVVKKADGGEVKDPLDSLESEAEYAARREKEAAKVPVAKPGDPGVVSVAFDDHGNAMPAKPQKKAGGGRISGDPAVDAAIDASAVNPAPVRASVGEPVNWNGRGPQDITDAMESGTRAALASQATQRTPLGALASFALPGEHVPASPVETPPADVAPRDAMKWYAQRAAEGEMGPLIALQAAYHGTPHRWAPEGKEIGAKFDLSKMGTGEGAQAYGWGAYATKKPEVAENYRQGLEAAKVRGLMSEREISDEIQNRILARARALHEADPVSNAKEIERLQAQAYHLKQYGPLEAQYAGTMDQDYGIDLTGVVEKPKGRLYKLDAPEDAELLHFGKQLRDHPPALKAKINGLFRQMAENDDVRFDTREIAPGLVDVRMNGMSIGAFTPDRVQNVIANPADHIPWDASTFYDFLAPRAPKVATERLRAAGIPGHLYRGDTSGVENMVIYDPERTRVVDAAPSLAEARKKNPNFAHGGAVKGNGMDLSRHKLLAETDTHWHVQGPTGSFKIAKQALSPAVREKVAAHFSRGGRVRGYSGEEGDPGAQVVTDDQGNAIGTQVPAEVSAPVAPVLAVPTAEPAPDAASPYDERGVIRDELRDSSGLAPGLGSTINAIRNVYRSPTDIAAERMAQSAAVPTTTAAPATETAPAPDPNAPQGPQGDAFRIPRLPGGGTGVNEGREIAEGFKAQSDAANKYADVVQAEADAKQRALAPFIAAKQAALKDATDRYAKAQAEGDDLYQKVKTGEIDPSRFWKDSAGNPDTGKKVQAAIGLILGGIGSGLTHQPNAALQVINNAIDRDIEAQRINLSKNTQLLGLTREEAARQEMVMSANMRDLAAGQLENASYSVAGDKQRAIAAQLAGQLRVQASQARQQSAALAAQTALHTIEAAQERALFPFKYQQAVIGANMAGLQMNALGQLIGGGEPGQGQGPGRPALGARIDPRAITFLPKEMRDTLVTLPDGSYAMARTQKDAEDTSRAFEHASILKQKLARYSELLRQHPHGHLTRAGTDFDTSKALHDSIITDLNALAGLNRLNEREVELFSNRVPDITNLQATAGHQAKLAELGNEISDKVWSASRQYLNLPSRPRTL